jgi:DNA polymerase alpha-associated DNA helicase A
MIRSKHPLIEIGSLDGFQGREKDCIILTLVRSNDLGKVGFLEDSRRMNVAITRARRHMVVVADGETVARGGGFLKKMVGYLEEYADIRFPE